MANAAFQNEEFKTFKHGVHPSENKGATSFRAIERVPFVKEYVMPLSQHTGAPSVSIVCAGQEVLRGERIADPGGFVSTTLHSPVTGRVTSLGPRLHANGKMMPAITIEADPYASQRAQPQERPDPAKLDNRAFAKQLQDAGLVGLGGAAFPSHVKVQIPEGKKIEYVVINGVECEPYLTCDDRLMVERPEAVIRGTQLLMDNTGARKAFIGIEANKPDAVEALRALAPRGIVISPLQVKYPQGAEKMLIKALLGLEVPSGGLPLDLDVLTNNVGTTAAIADWFDRGVPLIERVVTVTGPGIPHPRNLLVPLGTPLSALIEYCGGLRKETKQLIMGGPMMGMTQKSLDVPVMKGTSGLLALTRVFQADIREYPCIKCGRCLESCPMFLNPTRLANLARMKVVDKLADYNLMDCFECASCSYTCPSNIPLVQWIRIGKVMAREAQNKK
ncbi:MAG: electron transport complex subunit RsxC [Acidobacteriota bacterium]